MKLMHISDLHLGKRISEFSMTEDQKHILKQITEAVKEETPDAILIAGDVYDRSVPSTEAMELLEKFLYELADGKNQVFIISGNHDSAERLSFGSALIDRSGIHIAPVYSGEAKCYELQDDWGAVNIYTMPFVKPTNVRHALVNCGKLTEDEAAQLDSYAKAMRAAIENMDLDKSRRNVLVAHQFVTGAATCESEDVNVGGLDNIDADVFEDFDYVALGHLHGPQTLGSKKNIRYSGTPLKYSFSEVDHNKSITIVELGDKVDETAQLTIREIPLRPLHDWADVRGTFEQLTGEKFLRSADREAYTRVTLLDEDDVPEAISRLRDFYPNIMNLRYDNLRTRTENDVTDAGELGERSEIEMFEELFEKQNNAEMSQAQADLVTRLLEELKEEMA